MLREDRKILKIKKKNPKLLSLSGKIGSGKDYLYLNAILPFLKRRNKNVLAIAFGDFIKLKSFVYDNIPYNLLFHEKDEHTRKTLQNNGSIERKNDPDIYIKVVKCLIQMYTERGVDILVILDVRMGKELDFVKSLGSETFRIIAPDRTYDKIYDECEGDTEKMIEKNTHRSEIDLDDRTDEFDYVLNNDYMDLDSVKRMTGFLEGLYD